MFEHLFILLRAWKVKRLINPIFSNSILDIGCGNGYFLSIVDFKNKYGLERPFDLEYDLIPYGDESMDVVTMLAVWEHISPGRLDYLMGEIWRCLRKGGQFIVTTPNWWTGRLLKVVASLHLVNKELIDEHKGSYSVKQLVHIFKGRFMVEDFGHFELGLNNYIVGKKEILCGNG